MQTSNGANACVNSLVQRCTHVCYPPRIQRFPPVMPHSVPACQLVKQLHCTPPAGTVTFLETMAICQGDLDPGDCISVDQCVSGSPGCLPHAKGKEQDKDKHHGGAVFVDHASGFVFIENQVALTAGKTSHAKKMFEQHASMFSVSFEHFHADNTPFKSEAFTQNLKDWNQMIDFSGVGAHHQNGVTKCAAHALSPPGPELFCSHAALIWPDVANLELWPFALDHAGFCGTIYPIMRPTLLLSSCSLLNASRTASICIAFMCGAVPPVSLIPKLQDGKKIPKWDPRSHCRTAHGPFDGPFFHHWLDLQFRVLGLFHLSTTSSVTICLLLFPMLRMVVFSKTSHSV